MTSLGLPTAQPRASAPRSVRGRSISRAALYDAVYEGRGADVAVYLGLSLPLPGPVLELGAGSGRLLAPLLARGIDAYGLEVDANMLRAGRRRLSAVGGSRLHRRLVQGDMRHFAMGRLFSLVVVGCNTLSLLREDAELDATFDCVRRHLKPEGTLAFDVSLAEGHCWYAETSSWKGPTEAVWVDGVPAVSVERGHFDQATRLCTLRRVFRLVDGRRAQTTTVTRQRTLPELLERLEAGGFVATGVVDEGGAPVSAASCQAFIRATPC